MTLPLDLIKKSDILSDVHVQDFVAIGILNEGDIATHSAIIMKYNSQLFEFHYTGRDVRLDDLKSDFYHKITTVIPSFEIPSFLKMAQNIQRNASPNYGCFFSGEFYDQDGTHFSSNIGQYMTCVGFCLNVLKGFLHKDYLQHEDWDHSTAEGFMDKDDYFTFFIQEHNLDPNKFSKALRRITPLEMLTSSFFDDLPIGKTYIDKHKHEVKYYLQEIDIS